jgi:PTS system mannose-specific IID component
MGRTERNTLWFDESPEATARRFPSLGIMLRCFLRTYLVGAGFNFRGMQNIGMANIMDPALKILHRDKEQLRLARASYAKHYNTHPFWTPLVTGMFLKVEQDIAKGVIPRGILAGVKETAVNTLSAIGDSFFSGSLLPAWALLTINLLMWDMQYTAAGLGISSFFALQLFKALTFWYGYHDGLKVLMRLKRWNLINWGRRIKILNALLLTLVWVTVWPADAIEWQSWLAYTIGVTAVARMVYSFGIKREIILAGLAGAVLFAPQFLKMLSIQ